MRENVPTGTDLPCLDLNGIGFHYLGSLVGRAAHPVIELRETIKHDTQPRRSATSPSRLAPAVLENDHLVINDKALYA